MDGQPGLLINTRYGRKGIEGLITIIEQETGLPELLTGCRIAKEFIGGAISSRNIPEEDKKLARQSSLQPIVDAIAKATKVNR
jgi:hypothetical protein